MEKWLIDNSKATDIEKVIISGHYLFSSSEGKKILGKLDYKLKKKNIDMNKIIITEIKKNILKYLKNFRLVR